MTRVSWLAEQDRTFGSTGLDRDAAMMLHVRLTIIGAGAWGTTLAAVASEHLATTLWAREPPVLTAIHEHGENTPFLPGFPLPPALDVTVDLRSAVVGADMVIVAVPSPYVRDVLAAARAWIDPRAVVVSVTKGLEATTGKRMTEVITEVLAGHDPATIGLMAGPEPGPRGDGRTPVRDVRGVPGPPVCD